MSGETIAFEEWLRRVVEIVDRHGARKRWMDDGWFSADGYPVMDLWSEFYDRAYVGRVNVALEVPTTAVRRHMVSERAKRLF